MIQQEQATSGLSVEAMCEALDVSASGYYAWYERDSSPRQQADVRLGDEIEGVFIKSRRTYGSIGSGWRCVRVASAPRASGLSA